MASKTSPRIFFLSTLFTPFIEQDEIILSNHYTIEKLISSGWRAFLKIPGGVRRSDVTVVWFGSVYSGAAVFFAGLLGRKSVVIVAGIDASKDKEINYGIWLSPWKSVLVRYAYRHADRVLPVAPFLQKELIRLAEYDGANATYVPFGFDKNEWKPEGEKERMVLTVAACHDRWRMRKKGIEKILAAARSLPSVPFCIVGIHEHLVPEVRKEAPRNVELVSYLPRNELLKYYQKAKVYCQPSFTEGLPNTIGEAMLCGCIPVATRRGGIPTIVGEAGILVDYRNQEELNAALQRALDGSSEDGVRAREWISREFTLDRRERELRQVIDGLWS